VSNKWRNFLKRLGALLRTMMSGGSPNEREMAREKLAKLLREQGKTEGDIPNLMADLARAEAEEAQEKMAERAATADDPRPQQSAATKKARDIPCLELVDFFLRTFLSLHEHEYVAMALWTLHTHVFDRFTHTPRLTFVSPAPDCGKTRAMTILERLCFKPDKSDSVSPAALCLMLDQKPHVTTLLLDEMDNAELSKNAELRKVINSGHERSGARRRVIGGRLKRFSTFAPVALAAIGTNRPFPSPIISRSIVIKMQRSRRALPRLKPADISQLNTVYEQIRVWTYGNLQLELEPPLPPKLRNRTRDNWTPLVSIADSFGPAWGERAREALVQFKTGRDEDRGILALEDIREIFIMHAVDRFSTRELVDHLRRLEDTGWDDLGLTPSKLRTLLEPFGVKAKTIWPVHRTPKSHSTTGYLKVWFEDAWDRYCSEDEEPPDRSNVRQLRS
jgi:Protein of unknown function (DUF3631)